MSLPNSRVSTTHTGCRDETAYLTAEELATAVNLDRGNYGPCPACDPDRRKRTLQLYPGNDPPSLYCHRCKATTGGILRAAGVLPGSAPGLRKRPSRPRSRTRPTVDRESKKKARTRKLWSSRYNKAKPGPHSWADAKRIPQGYAGSRVWHGPGTGAGVLLVPGPDGKPAQRIRADGFKTFLPGPAPAPRLIPGSRSGPPVIVESYANAHAVQQDTSPDEMTEHGRPVILAWNAGGLKAAGRMFPEAVILADNDARDAPDADIVLAVLGRTDTTGTGHKYALETGRAVYMDPRPGFDAWDVWNTDSPGALDALLDGPPASDRTRWTGTPKTISTPRPR